MKKITQIEFVNYKAFYGEGEENKIIIPEGKNVLIYGENGSGKSTLYEGLKQFFSSANDTIDVSPYRNIYVPKTKIIDEGTPNEREVTEDVKVKLTFKDNNAIVEEKTFGVPDGDTRGTDYIRKASLLNSFLSYKELLRTYLMHNSNDKDEFKEKFAELLIEQVLANHRNSATQNTYITDWENLFRPKGWNKIGLIADFNIGLKSDVGKINLVLNEILKFFDSRLEVEIIPDSFKVKYHYSPKKRRQGNYPIYKIDLKVLYDGVEIDNGEENHLTVLNEARLSALAISIYLSALVVTPQENLDFKLLFLDDIFIGLDMSNRLPLLEILNKFRKPIIEPALNQRGEVVEGIKLVNNEKQYENFPFFRSYQIFITTYDRHWFEIAKFSLNKNIWTSVEMYQSDEDEQFSQPIVISPSLDYYQRSLSYFKKGSKDYPAAANYLRKEYERVFKSELLYGKYLLKPDGNKGALIEKDQLGELWDTFKIMISDLDLDLAPFKDFEIVVKTVLNPLSHDNLSKPIYKKELQNAFDLLSKLYTIRRKVILKKGEEVVITTNNSIVRRTYLVAKEDVLVYKQFNGNSVKYGFANKFMPLRYEELGTITPLYLPEVDLKQAFSQIYFHVFNVPHSLKYSSLNVYDYIISSKSSVTVQSLLDDI